MYYLMNLTEKIRIPADMLGMSSENGAKKVLRDNYERRVFDKIGFILSIDDIELLGEGVVVPGDPHVYYTVQFNALVFNTSVNEILEAEVKEIVEFGAFATIGPFDGLLHVSQIAGDKFYYDKKTKTLTSRAKKNIKKGDALVVKISTISLKPSLSDTKIGFTMRSNGLGKREWLDKEKKKIDKKKEYEKKKNN